MRTMRKETFGVGTYVHLINRGARQGTIVRDESDRWRFLKLLRYLNDDNTPRNWERDIGPDHIRNNFERPTDWSQAKPYVSIVAYCLMDNHFHLLVREQEEGGISTFMHRLSTSMASHFNAKYNERGGLFQGPYIARVVTDDTHLQYLATYIQVKNTLERYPEGGMETALKEFERAFLWAQNDIFCSLADYVGNRRSALVNHALIADIFPDRKQIRRIAQDILTDRYEVDDELAAIIID